MLQNHITVLMHILADALHMDMNSKEVSRPSLSGLLRHNWKKIMSLPIILWNI